MGSVFIDDFESLVKKSAEADTHVYGKVVSVNQDGSYQVALSSSGIYTRCVKGCQAKANDVVLVLIKKDGKCVAISNVTNPVPFLIGEIKQYAGSITSSTAPSGWLLCDGSAVSRTTYASLFSVIGTTYGTGDESTTFNLPKCAGDYIVEEGDTTTGTSNTWHYRKWASGRAECEGIFTRTLTHYATKFGGYGYTTTVTLPFEFTTAPSAIWNAKVGTGFALGGTYLNTTTSLVTMFAIASESDTQPTAWPVRIEGQWSTSSLNFASIIYAGV